jgi:hypothetical protein
VAELSPAPTSSSELPPEAAEAEARKVSRVRPEPAVEILWDGRERAPVVEILLSVLA